MFADSRIAARIDRAEANLTREVAAAVAARGVDGVLVHPIGGGVASLVRPGSPMNKLIGVGFAGTLDEEALAAIESAWHQRGEPVRAEVSTLADAQVLTQLVDRGYRLIAFENVLGLSLAGRVSAATTDVAVAPAAREELPAWREAMLTGVAHPDGTGAGAEELPRDVLEEVLSDFLEADGFVRYLARLGVTVAGTATMRIDGGIAQLCGAATIPALRRRGVQGALLAARLRDADAAGCDIAAITTAPGSQSQANAQRRGFELLYARAVLIKSAPR